ncbi:MAG: hypothetical protein Q9170_001910 [Blastenia crenularia]
MTSNISGTQWVPKPPDHPKAQISQHPSRSLLRHHSKSVTVPRSNDEPAFKKQRLDHDSIHEAFLSTSLSQQTSFIDDAQSLLPGEPTLKSADATLTALPKSPSSTALCFPRHSTSVHRQTSRQCHGSSFKPNNRILGAVQIKPFILEPTSTTPRYHSSHGVTRPRGDNAAKPNSSIIRDGPADFAPWRGNHTEDALSETSIKQGFYDKTQVSQAESITAKPSIWSGLKHKSGLQVLSSLVVAVLDQRQGHGTTTAGCTFKPPPRVTLTDSKRESWLRDLANPSIPLRRLSRTIPHGIRGRALLDHSLAKNIPTARSLWLVKCVGANEIRAFKRKGASGAFAAGGEAKWIRDWTANVEQFLDLIISTCRAREGTDGLTYG